MKLTTLTLALLAAVGTGCASVSPAPPVAVADLPNCFDSNYDRELNLFTVKGDTGTPVNQKCLLWVGSSADAASTNRLRAGTYHIVIANGGGGGAGGSRQSVRSPGGGGGGGGAGSRETDATINLAAGAYKLTLGGGGPGGTACKPGLHGGGPGWLGSPSSMIEVASGTLLIGTVGADTYARPSRSQNDRMTRPSDGRGGFGPGQTSGGQGAISARPPSHVQVAGAAGESRGGPQSVSAGGTGGTVSAKDQFTGGGGGGGATTRAHGGDAGGESRGQMERPPERGSLGSGGGGGEGSLSECDPGARGGHGFIELRPI